MQVMRINNLDRADKTDERMDTTNACREARSRGILPPIFLIFMYFFAFVLEKRTKITIFVPQKRTAWKRRT
jgi:hypothetical protein